MSDHRQLRGKFDGSLPTRFPLPLSRRLIYTNGTLECSGLGTCCLNQHNVKSKIKAGLENKEGRRLPAGGGL